MQNGTKLEELMHDEAEFFDFHFQCGYNPQFIPLL